MPVIKFEGPQLTQEQRKALVEGFTEVACKVIPQIPKDAYYVFVLDYPDDKIGVGGLMLPEYLAKIQKNE